jgi:hypothetical protein
MELGTAFAVCPCHFGLIVKGSACCFLDRTQVYISLHLMQKYFILEQFGRQIPAIV